MCQSKVIDTTSAQCFICLDGFANGEISYLLGCGNHHQVHEGCWLRYMDSLEEEDEDLKEEEMIMHAPRCPMCRGDIDTITPAVSQNYYKGKGSAPDPIVID